MRIDFCRHLKYPFNSNRMGYSEQLYLQKLDNLGGSTQFFKDTNFQKSLKEKR